MRMPLPAVGCEVQPTAGMVPSLAMALATVVRGGLVAAPGLPIQLRRNQPRRGAVGGATGPGWVWGGVGPVNGGRVLN